MRSMRVRACSRRRRAQRHGLERQLQARERRLELVRDQREEVVLLLEHARLGAQRARDHRDAQPEREQEERALPGVLAVAVALLGEQRLLDAADASVARPSLTAMSGSSCVHARRRRCRPPAAPARPTCCAA